MKQQFSLFLIFLSYLSFSQTVDVKWGPPKKYKKSSVEYGFVGQDQSGIYTLSYDDKLLFLTKTSKDNLGKIFEKQLLWENLRSQIKSRDITFRGFKKFKTHFVLFQNDIDNKANKRVLYGQKVNFNGDAEGALTKLDDNELARQSKEGSMSLIYSKDSLKFAILKNPTFDKYADEKFNFKIYDSDLKLLHRLELELPFRDKFFTLVETKLGSDNTIYLLAKVEIPRDKKQKEEAQFYYTVVTVNPKEGGEVKIFDIKLDGKYVDEVSMEIDKDDNLRCLGLYSNLNERGKPEKGLHGLVYLTVDKQSKQIGNKSIKEFSKALVEELSGKKRAEKDKGIETSFKLKYFLEKEDESFVALMEEEYMTVTTSTYMTGNGGMRTTTTYHYDSNSILAINIDSEGKIHRL